MPLVVREVEVAGERFLVLGEVLLVASKAEPNLWHRIDGAHCDCRGFQFRGVCRHVVAAAQLKAPEPLPAPSPSDVLVEWSDQFGGWLVGWAGFVHGGVHYKREDADAHADALREAPDSADWVVLHQPAAPSTQSRSH